MAGRRKKRRGITFIPVVILCGAVIGCIIFTGLILWSMLPEKTAAPGKKSYMLQNAYIIGNRGDRLRVFYGDRLYDFKGRLKKDYSGVADLKVRDGEITKCVQKPDTVEGVLLSYTARKMEIGDLGECDRNPDLALYRRDGENISGAGMKDLIVGVSRLTCVFENGKICALILDGQQKLDSIHVLLKDGEKLRHKKLYLSAEAEWRVQGRVMEKGQVCAAGELFPEKGVKSVRISCDKGLLYRCDAKGNRLGNGYSGVFILHRGKKGYVLVNELPMETYVSCVLPSEMDPDYALEALKAQAICARTFAYTQMKGDTYARWGANLDDSTAFQVYNKGERTHNSDRAVGETAGKVLTFKGAPARCYYYSTSPGVTGDLSLWEDAPLSYLTNVNGLREGQPGDLSKEKNFKAYISGVPKSWDSSSPYYRWDGVVELSGVSDQELGKLKEIRVIRRHKSGYIGELSCRFAKGEHVLKNENKIRSLLGRGLVSLTLSDGSKRELSMLPSACFGVVGEKDGRLTIRGGGFGHGIGMSQCGAGALGEAGKSCQEILSFYYPGTKIMKTSDLY